MADDSQGSGYRECDGIYSSLASPVAMPLHPHLDFVSYMFSQRFGRPESASNVAILDGKSGQSLTCSQLRRSIEAVATGLHESGICQGDVVMILLPNTLEFPVMFNAALRIGAVVTTMNPQNTPAEIARQMLDSRPKMVLTNRAGVDKVRAASPDLPIVLVDEEEREEHGRTLNSDEKKPQFIPFSRFLASDPDQRPRNRCLIRQSDPAALLYSSGTTGLSKGVVISHGNLIAAMAVQNQVPEEMDRGDTNVVLFPMYHIGGLMWLCCGAIMGGPTFVLLQRYGLADLLRAVERHGANKITSAPPVALDLLHSAQTVRYDLRSLRALICAAAPLSKETIQGLMIKFPHLEMFIQMYGMTETVTVGSGGRGVMGSSGRLNATLEARVVDLETRKSLPPNQRGELWLRGSPIMQGYLNNPVATAEAIDSDGWLHTGDLVYFDSKGYLYIVDRLKELIKYKGYQVAPAELEALLLTHPAIVDCAVVPFPDEVAGEIPQAFIVRARDNSISSEEVMRYVADQVAPYKRIRRVSFLDKIPKSAAGKILRNELKKAASKL
ncbi:hypothetical protein SELMODRAFT_143817 [Selaginella moellendorffii]|uniref:4-coumarate--CoA ligase n=2 Tax=Selaginella moellendorffii TaxID=88036 RepID=D8R5S8_SELML|nr:hypothetical protein SELMODRAFT_143817 [Selaginella moellendorffii]